MGRDILMGPNFELEPTALQQSYDPASGAFATTGSMAVARTFHTATLLESGEVLIAGGSSSVSAEVYTP